MAGFSLFYGPLIPLTDALAATWQRQVGLDYGKVRLWGSMAFVIGSAVTGEVVNAFGHKAIMYCLWAGLAAMLVGMLLRPRHMPQDAPKDSAVQETTPWKILLKEAPVWRFYCVPLYFKALMPAITDLVRFTGRRRAIPRR